MAEDKTLERILIKSYKKYCAVGDSINSSDIMVVGIYSDGSENRINTFDYNPHSIESFDDSKLTVTYDGFMDIVRFSLLESIEVSDGKFEYTEGEELVPSNFVFHGKYKGALNIREIQDIMPTDIIITSPAKEPGADKLIARAGMNKLFFSYKNNERYLFDTDIIVIEEGKFSVKFISYHKDGDLSNEYIIERYDNLEMNAKCEAPDFSGDNGYTFIRWDSDEYKTVTKNANIHALCKPTWDTLKGMTESDRNRILNDTELNDNEFGKIVSGSTLKNKIAGTLTKFVEQPTARVGSAFTNEGSYRRSDLVPFNPETSGSCCEFDEAAANSIINTKKLDIVFKPGVFSAETKTFIQDKVMPYLTSVIPSTTILSYYFEGEIEQDLKNHPSAQYYIVDNSGNTIEFESFVASSKEYHLRVVTEPDDFEIGLDISASTEEEKVWVDIERTSKNDFYISVNEDYKPGVGIGDREIYITGTVRTYVEDSYSGIKEIPVNIKCVQKAFVYPKYNEDVMLRVEAVQLANKSGWVASWESDIKIPVDCYRILFRGSGSTESWKSYNISGGTGNFNIDIANDILEYKDDVLKTWEVFDEKNQLFRVYSVKAVVTPIQSKYYLELIPRHVEISPEGGDLTFDIQSNASWKLIITNITEGIEIENTGASGDYSYKKMISANTTSDVIQFKIELICSDDDTLRKTLMITQMPKVAIDKYLIEFSSIDIVPETAIYTITISNSEASKDEKYSGMTISEIYCGFDGDMFVETEIKEIYPQPVSADTLTFKVNGNTTKDFRSGNINILITDNEGNKFKNVYNKEQQPAYVVFTSGGSKPAEDLVVAYTGENVNLSVSANTYWEIIKPVYINNVTPQNGGFGVTNIIITPEDNNAPNGRKCELSVASEIDGVRVSDDWFGFKQEGKPSNGDEMQI